MSKSPKSENFQTTFLKIFQKSLLGAMVNILAKIAYFFIRSPPSSDFDSLINVEKCREMTRNVIFANFVEVAAAARPAAISTHQEVEK
jgi:hypothetical protein